MNLLTNKCSLIFQAILSQYQGDTAKCWTLIAHASTICKALGWHDPTSFTFDPQNEAESEVFAAVHQCYVLDKSISMKHNRPVSLPGLGYLSSLSETRFVGGPFSIVIKASLHHAQIQDKIIQQLQSNSHLSETDRVAIVTSLSEELSVFKSEYDQVGLFMPICESFAKIQVGQISAGQCWRSLPSSTIYCFGFYTLLSTDRDLPI